MMPDEQDRITARRFSASRWRLPKVLAGLAAICASTLVLPAQAGPICNGGPVLTNPQNVYCVYYGDGWTDSEKQMTQQFIGDLSGSSYFNINTTYGATTQLNYGGSASVTSSSGAAWAGTSLSGYDGA